MTTIDQKLTSNQLDISTETEGMDSFRVFKMIAMRYFCNSLTSRAQPNYDNNNNMNLHKNKSDLEQHNSTDVLWSC